MNAALEPAPTVLEPVRKRLLSVADYHRMGETGILGPDERVELIEGEITTVSPPIGPVHTSHVNRLNHLLVEAVGRQAIVQVQSPIRLSDFSEPEPDLTLLRRHEDFYATALPGPADTLLAIEVADSTLAYDRDVKVPLYARHGIPEVWLIDVQGERLMTYREPAEKGYRRELTQRPPEALEPALLPGVTIDLSGLFTTS